MGANTGTRALQLQDQLCATCHGAIQNLDGIELKTRKVGSEWELHLSHHLTFIAFESAASLGCYLCRITWNKLSKTCQHILLNGEASLEPAREHYHWQLEKSFATKIHFQSYTKSKGDPGAHIHVTFSPQVDKLGGVNPRQVLAFFLAPKSSLEAQEAEKSPVTCSSTTTASSEAWETAQKWLEDCRSTHKACKHPGLNWFPTRLLDLGDYQYARVIESRSSTLTGSYVTLSHRWSSQPSLTLSKTTKSQLYSHFDMACLPKAIQDASLVCKRLDIQYLWVDSLCILQDDEGLADWKRESALMGSVYENALLNISALAAMDTRHSFFTKRDPLDVNEVRIYTKLDCSILKLGDTMHEYRLTDSNFWITHVHTSHLNKRAWVMQEKSLAARVLYFGQQQLLWECAVLKAAETYPTGLPELTITSMSAHNIGGGDLGFRHLVSEGALEILHNEYGNESDEMYDMAYNMWSEMVSGYSKCKATKASDKLIAISGLAKRMALFVKDSYVVGMWRRNLPYDLMWYCDNYIMSEDRFPGPRRSRLYRAPTFSWASMDAIIIPSNSRDKKLSIQILDINLDFISEDPTGLCKSGHLILRSKLQRAVIRTRTKEHKEDYEEKHTLHITESDDKLTQIESPVLDELPSFFDPVDRDDLFSVPCQYYECAGGKGRPYAMIYYLLFRASERGSGIFQRIGWARCVCYDENWGTRLSAGRTAAEYPCLSYDEGWHTIKVI